MGEAPPMFGQRRTRLAFSRIGGRLALGRTVGEVAVPCSDSLKLQLQLATFQL
jgi:hypothetical protein